MSFIYYIFATRCCRPLILKRFKNVGHDILILPFKTLWKQFYNVLVKLRLEYLQVFKFTPC